MKNICRETRMMMIDKYYKTITCNNESTMALNIVII